ncbi:L-threonylcarbamoyladenylate synthase [Brachyspira pilosicoli]|uniref:L-threonylcarbamoyladenylate synthase n=1 Tax=Brachyspira pilosicoli TaxID=52584 RepID=UPI003006EA23
MVIELDKNNSDSIEYAVEEVAKVINNGGVVISPTDTVYGMLADAFNVDAINRIYSIKEREREKPLLILLKDSKFINILCEGNIPDIVKAKIPGELTFIMPLKEIIKKDFLYLKNTVALRIPKDDYMEKLLKLTPPLVAPSANPTGYGVIYDGNKLVELYKDKVDLILNCGTIEKKLPSTLYDCINNKVLRQGSVYL